MTIMKMSAPCCNFSAVFIVLSDSCHQLFVMQQPIGFYLSLTSAVSVGSCVQNHMSLTESYSAEERPCCSVWGVMLDQ